MKVNVCKTKDMLLGTSARTNKINNINVVMNNYCTVEKVNSFKYLRVNIDENLKWNYHIRASSQIPVVGLTGRATGWRGALKLPGAAV